MKPLHAFLALSLFGNAALLFSARRATASPTAEKSPATARASLNEAATLSRGAAGSDSARHGSSPAPSLWSRVNCDDIEQFADRLKEAGFTAQEISAIVMPRLMARFSPAENGAPRSYWQFDRPDYSDPKTQEFFHRNAAEQQRLLRKFWRVPELIATDAAAQESARRRFGNLPLEKLQALQQLEDDYEQLSLKASLEQHTRPGENAASDPSTAWRLLEQEKLKDLTKLLTPEEFAAYETRNSQLAQTLKFQLRTFQPTEEEYLALFAIRKNYASQLADRTQTPDHYRAVMADIEKDVAKVLGAERAEDYAASTQNPNDETANLVLRLGLPARVAPQVRTLQRDFTAQAAAIRANAQISAADRTAQLSALAQQARTALTEKLGAQGFEVYDDRKGEWIRALENPAPGRP